MATTRKANGGSAVVNVFDGTRQLYSDKGKLLITVIDGNQKTQHRDFHDQSSLSFTGLPLFNNFGDNYTFLASADGYKDAGFQPVKLAANLNPIVDLLLIPRSNQLNFANATWKALDNSRPGLKALLANGAASAAEAAQRYGDVMEDQGGAILACLLNITTAMQQIQLPQRTPLDFIKRIIWDREGEFAMAQDRFFAWADVELKNQINQAKQQPRPKFMDVPFALHPGATSSYKEIEFGEANVQFTFHENNKMKIDGVNCVIVEPDIDYFKDIINHLVLEVLVNSLGSVTDPRAVYVLRWIAGRRAGVPEFDPLYTIRRA